ncbi:MAG: F0F1 ATP synthase subunit B [Sphingobium sp.]
MMHQLLFSTAAAVPAETTALTHAYGAVEHEGPTLLGLGAEGWVYVGLTIFLLLAIFVAKAPRKLLDGLDSRILAAKQMLDEAGALRAEAEKLLKEALVRQTESVKDAKAILARAEEDAAQLLVDAKADAAELITRRKKMAQDKIAAAERAAIADIRTRAAHTATTAASSLIAQTHDGSADKRLVDDAIASLNPQLIDPASEQSIVRKSERLFAKSDA